MDIYIYIYNYICTVRPVQSIPSTDQPHPYIDRLIKDPNNAIITQTIQLLQYTTL